MSDLLDAALRYAARGWRVFPVYPIRDGKCACGKECGANSGKHPMTVNGHHEATTNEAEIREAWTAVPDANIGVATGNGLLVVDVDPRNGGDVSYEGLGASGTLLSRTGGAGFHFFFEVPTDLKWPGKLVAGIDVKGEGGYVLVPPSLHLSGTPYQWIDGRTTPKAAPQWLLDRATKSTDCATTEPNRATSPPATLSILHHAADWLKKHGPAIQGQGGDSHTYKAGAYLFHDLALTWEEGRPLLEAWNRSCEPPWEPTELKAKAYRETYARPEIPKGEARTFIRLLDNLRGETSITNTPNTESKPTLFEPLPAFLARKYPRPPWLINGVLAEQSVHVLGGEPKVSKTWAGLELGLSLVTGTPAFGEFEVPNPRPVVFFLVEDDARSAANRVRSLLAGKNVEGYDALSQGHIRCRQSLNILDDTQFAGLIKAVLAIPEIAMIYLDPMRDLHLADENSSGDMAAVMGRLRTLRDETKASVVFAHHTGKASDSTKDRRPGQRLRGSGAIHGAIDSGLYLYDLDTDGINYWATAAEVEMKGFRGAGCFHLKLDVKDSPDGEAVWAKWSHGKENGSLERKILKAAEDASPEELYRTDLTRLAGVNEGNGLRAIKRLVLEGKLVETFAKKIRWP